MATRLIYPTGLTDDERQNIGTGGGGGGRDTLTADRNYYVSTTGSDSNDGLTIGTPFLTIQKAIDTIAMLDLSIYDAIVNLADGTYNVLAPIVLKDPIGAGNVIIRGNTGDKTLVILDGNATTNQLFSGGGNKSIIEFLTGTNAVQSFIHSGGYGSSVGVRNIRLLDIGPRAIYAVSTGAAIFLRGIIDYDYTGGTVDNIILTLSLEAVIDCQSATINITGNPSFTDAMTGADRSSSVNLISLSVSGAFSGTGVRAINSSVVLISGATGIGSTTTATNGQIHT